MTVVDDIENSLKAEEIESMQNRQQQSTEGNILDMNDAIKSEEIHRTRTNSNRYLLFRLIAIVKGLAYDNLKSLITLIE